LIDSAASEPFAPPLAHAKRSLKVAQVTAQSPHANPGPKRGAPREFNSLAAFGSA
jgi:hypothetical protein